MRLTSTTLRRTLPTSVTRRWISLATASLVVASTMITAAPVVAITPSNGNQVASRTTIPRGAAFLNDGNGGHWWVSDQVLGLCRLDAQAGPPAFFLNACNGTAKSGGQVIVGDTPTTPADGSHFLYVADSSSKSIKVVRFVFTPGAAGANGSISTPNAMNVQNPTSVGGGAGGGRPVGLAIAAHKGGGQDLYVGYLKSGDIMRIDNVQAVANNNANPTVAKVGSTSDGRGLNSLAILGNDLYLAEIGGFGLSKIADPSGITRTACGAAAPCTAVSVSPSPTFFPGGLATDGTYLFIGDAPLASTGHQVLRYNPASGVTDVYSASISPSYVSGGTTFTSYINPLGLGYNAANGDLLVGDDPQATAATPVLQQGHYWKVTHPAAAVVPSVTGIAPSSGSSLGGDAITVTGKNLTTTDAGGNTVLPTIDFGTAHGTGVACASATTCTVTSPAGIGTVDVRVTLIDQTSAAAAADQFSYIVANNNAITVTAVAPGSGATIGATKVTITGTNLATIDAAGNVTATPTINFGANAATGVACASATTCTAVSPAGAAGVVDVHATLAGQTSASAAGNKYTYVTPTASLYSWGITAPKGGAVFLPGALGGHWWSSDHAQGLCRQDLVSSAPSPFNIAGDTLHAINFAVCGDDLVGSAGQAVYDARLVHDIANNVDTKFHYVYVPDNAVKSTAVWRLTFDPATETMVADPNGGAMATAMTPLADVRTLKPNGMALGPDGNLYVSDLTEPNIRRITNPDGDPRTQTITIVAVTGDNRGANGTQGFIGNLLYISGNRAPQFFDVTRCPMAAGPCGMASVPAPTGVFVAGTITDAPHGLVYFSSSPGGANATIFRYDASTDVYVPFLAGSVAADAFGVVTCPACTVGAQALQYISGGVLPNPSSPNGNVTCALQCIRPWDQGSHPTTGIAAGAGVPTTFAFVFGLGAAPDGTVVITEDPSAGARSGRGTMWTLPYLP